MGSFPVTAAGETFTSDSFSSKGYVSAFPAMLRAFSLLGRDPHSQLCTSYIYPSLGGLNILLPRGLGLVTGQLIQLANPAGRFILCRVYSYLPDGTSELEVVHVDGYVLPGSLWAIGSPVIRLPTSVDSNSGSGYSKIASRYQDRLQYSLSDPTRIWKGEDEFCSPSSGNWLLQGPTFYGLSQLGDALDPFLSGIELRTLPTASTSKATNNSFDLQPLGSSFYGQVDLGVHVPSLTASPDALKITIGLTADVFESLGEFVLTLGVNSNRWVVNTSFANAAPYSTDSTVSGTLARLCKFSIKTSYSDPSKLEYYIDEVLVHSATFDSPYNKTIGVFVKVEQTSASGSGTSRVILDYFRNRRG